jgi:NitT/TauT family transport system permease protein
MLPFLLVACLYLWGSHHLRQVERTEGGQAAASSKLMPEPGEMVDGFVSTIKEDPKGDRRLVLDTVASLKRFGIGMAIVFLGIFIGLYMGTLPFVEALLHRFFVFWDKVPPLLLLPILFLVFDIGELSKVALVVIGVLPGVVLDAYMRTKEISREQFYKAQTLGASEAEIPWAVVLPQIFPKMLGSLRLNFKAAWCYVIAGESIAAAVGIGYRIFVLRRYVAMDIIIPYVIWATLIMFALDYTFQWLEKRYRWVDK